MFYCDRSCQRKDWFEGHKFSECAIFKKFGRIESDAASLLLRVYLKVTANPNLITKRSTIYSGQQRAFQDLMDHKENILEDKERLAQFEFFMELLNGADLANDDHDLVLSIYGKLFVNAFGIIESSSFDELGTGLYIEGSVFDHSCNPNAVWWFDGIKMQIKAIRKIRSDEPIFLNYINLEVSRVERRRNLSRKYYFNCMCERCGHEDEEGDLIDYAQMVEYKEKLAEIAIISKNFGLSRDQLKRSFEIRREMFPIYEQVYRDFHPNLLLLMGKLFDLSIMLHEDPDIVYCESCDVFLKRITEKFHVMTDFFQGDKT